MQKPRFAPAFGLVFVLFCASLSPLASAAAVFDLSGVLALGDTRLDLIRVAPVAARAGLQRINDTFRRESLLCRDLGQAEGGLVKTKAYLAEILKRVADASDLGQRMNTQYGVCINPQKPGIGMFASMFGGGPRLAKGTIQVPVEFLLKLKSEDELAFVLAHELSHFLLHFEIFETYLEATKRSGDAAFELAEREADELGMRLIVNAGYDLDHALDSVERMRSEDPLHPHTDEIEALKNRLLREMVASGVSYRPTMSGRAFLPKAVMEEVTNVVTPRTSALSN